MPRGRRDEKQRKCFAQSRLCSRAGDVRILMNCQRGSGTESVGRAIAIVAGVRARPTRWPARFSGRGSSLTTGSARTKVGGPAKRRSSDRSTRENAAFLARVFQMFAGRRGLLAELDRLLT